MQAIIITSEKTARYLSNNVCEFEASFEYGKGLAKILILSHDSIPHVLRSSWFYPNNFEVAEADLDLEELKLLIRTIKLSNISDAYIIDHNDIPKNPRILIKKYRGH